ncbi:MAG: (deoxy)nucleoside triphosphate pyrophosphohydrolase [Corallincola sp.]|nr:(deoxy)nucleoside triphosphate pyrophosphohydrolase [Corallincola sp.]
MTIEVVAAIISHNGLVLAARRAPHKADAGLWEFPGGKVEAGESHAQALAREIQEELGLAIAVGESLGSVHHPSKPLVMHGYHCQLVDGMPQRSSDHDLLRWLSSDELFQLAWAPLDPPLLTAVAALLGQLRQA